MHRRRLPYIAFYPHTLAVGQPWSKYNTGNMCQLRQTSLDYPNPNPSTDVVVQYNVINIRCIINIFVTPSL